MGLKGFPVCLEIRELYLLSIGRLQLELALQFQGAHGEKQCDRRGAAGTGKKVADDDDVLQLIVGTARGPSVQPLAVVKAVLYYRLGLAVAVVSVSDY